MNEEIKYQFTSTLEEDDYKKFLRHITFRESKNTFGFLGIIAGILTILLSMLINLSNILAILAVLAILYMLVLSFLLMKLDRQAKKLYADNSPFKKEQQIELSFDIITTSNRMDDGNTSANYTALYKIVETTDFIFFFFSKEIVSPIRKKDIPKEQYEEIITLLKEKVGKRYISQI